MAASTKRLERSYPRQPSKAAALLDQQIGTRQTALPEYLLDAAGEVRPLLGFGVSRLGNNIGKKAIPLVEFNRLSGPKPRLQLASVSKLTKVNLRHNANVSHYVMHVNPYAR